MEFLKKNYEKLLLAVVLLILTVAACSLPFIISAKRTALQNYIVTATSRKAKPIANLDMTPLDSVIQRSTTPIKLDYTTQHNLVNPVPWKKLADGHLLKEDRSNMEGPEALVVTAIKPLYLDISYGSPSGSSYMLTIENQAAARPDRRHTSTLVGLDNKGGLVSLQAVKGPADHPTELDLVWNETGDAIKITPDQGYRKIDGYMGDLKYPLEAGKVWTDRRVGSLLNFANGSYKIVAITDSSVVVSDQSNNKKTTIPFHP